MDVSNVINKPNEEKKINSQAFTSGTKILEAIKTLLVVETNKDNNCISAYQISEFLKNKNNRYEKIKEYYESSMKYTLNSYYRKPKFKLYGFDYKTDELIIGFGINNYDEIRFLKNNDDLSITKSRTYNDQHILAIIGDQLSEVYDELMKYKDYKTQKKYGLSTINSKFLVNFSNDGISIYAKKPSQQFLNDFELRAPSYDNHYQYDCNSSIVISTLQGNESKFLQKIFVKIEDCPKWAQQSLYEIRQTQLEEQQNREVERIDQEIKKQKRLGLKRKIFPWLKKYNK